MIRFDLSEPERTNNPNDYRWGWATEALIAVALMTPVVLGVFVFVAFWPGAK